MSTQSQHVSNKSGYGSGSTLASLLVGVSVYQAKAPDMVGENDDPCHSNLGHYDAFHEQLMSDTLGLKQQLVGNDENMISGIVKSEWPKVVAGLYSMSKEDRETHIVLLFKLAYFSRAIRCQGGRSRVQFYVLLQKLRKQFPEETLTVVSLIPHYGCFQDVDHLVDVFTRNGDKDMRLSLLCIYRDFMTTDLSRLLGCSVMTLSIGDLHTRINLINTKLKVMNDKQLGQFLQQLSPGQFSWAGKWVKREGKKNSSHRDDLVRLMFGYTKSSSNKTMDYGRMVLRKCASVLSQCLRIPEHNMTEATSRGWGDIQLKYIPSKATTMYRKALANETNDGSERSCREDRRKCAQNTMKAIMEGKLNGAQQDLKNLVDLIWDRIRTSSVLTDTERMMINAQWGKMVEFVNQLIEDTLAKDRQLRKDAIKAGDTSPEPMRDPRAVLPVVDVSGSMSCANVMHYAIAMGIVCATISSIPGKLITFSTKPVVFDFDPKADIFDVFRKIQQCDWGMNTNLDATYHLLLREMNAARTAGMTISTDFSLLVVTDGQFDNMISFGEDTNSYGHSRPVLGNLSGFDSFQSRQEKAFTAAGFGVPLVVYWNMALNKSGFPVQSSTTGVKLVAGFSQTVMVEVMTSDYKTVIDPDTCSVKVGVTPLESFLKTMSDDSLQFVEDKLREFWSLKATDGKAKVSVQTTVKPHPLVPKSLSDVPTSSQDAEIAELEKRLVDVKMNKIAELKAELKSLEES